MAKRDRTMWDEFQGVQLGDNRLATRLIKLAEAVAAEPTASFPELFPDGADLEAAYRFVNNEAVTLAAILAPHVRETVARCHDRTIIAAHDTTIFSYAGRGKRRGLASHRSAQEFRSHVTLAVTADDARDPLGVLCCETWVRGEDQEKGSEGRRWFRQADAVAHLDGLDAKRVIHVMDREADDYPMFLDLKQQGHRFVVRAASNRRVLDEEATYMRDALERVAAKAKREVPLTARGTVRRSAQERSKFPPRNARLATLEISALEVEVKRPVNQPRTLAKTCKLNIVRVWEPTPPTDETPVEWVLVTNEPIETEEDVLAVVDAYRARWRIEEYFKAIKTGCAFEARQLESYEALTNALAITMPIAWRILRLRSQADHAPDLPGTTLLDKDEIAVLRAKLPKERIGTKPSRKVVLMAVARLGGHLPRNGAPGWKVLRRGMERLEGIVEGYRLASKIRQRRRTQDQS